MRNITTTMWRPFCPSSRALAWVRCVSGEVLLGCWRPIPELVSAVLDVSGPFSSRFRWACKFNNNTPQRKCEPRKENLLKCRDDTDIRAKPCSFPQREHIHRCTRALAWVRCAFGEVLQASYP